MNPDLGAFKARDCWLIHYHGWSDPDITPLNSINYYESVMKAQGSDVHGLGSTVEFYRLFMGAWDVALPGSGPGTTNFDMIEPLEKWAEKGVAPDKVIASHATNGVVDAGPGL